MAPGADQMGAPKLTATIFFDLALITHHGGTSIDSATFFAYQKFFYRLGSGRPPFSVCHWASYKLEADYGSANLSFVMVKAEHTVCHLLAVLSIVPLKQDSKK